LTFSRSQRSAEFSASSGAIIVGEDSTSSAAPFDTLSAILTPALAGFILLSFIACVAGGLLPTIEGVLDRLGPARVLSLRSGVLIAVALTDVLPEARRLSAPVAAAAALTALALGWFLHHDHETHGSHEGHELTHPHLDPAGGRHHLTAAAAALFVHSLIDGVNLGAIAAVGGPALWAVGAAISLHKLADGFTVSSLYDGKRPRVFLPLLLVSLASPLGAVLARAGTLSLGPLLTASLLGFAGGSFLFVGAAQIVPHLKRERDLPAALFFAAGLGAMVALSRFFAF
jgi:ZIP family zinc transporter